MKPLYDEQKLARLMEDAGVDLLLAHTPHNIRYLTGGYYFHFRERCDRHRAEPVPPLRGGSPGKSRKTLFRWPGASRRHPETRWTPGYPMSSTRRRGEPSARPRRPPRRSGSGGWTREPSPSSAPSCPWTRWKRLRANSTAEGSWIRWRFSKNLRAVKREDELEIFRRAALADSEAIQAGFQEGSARRNDPENRAKGGRGNGAARPSFPLRLHGGGTRHAARAVR